MTVDREAPKLKILLVEDHVLVRQSLAKMLNDDGRFEVVGEAENSKQGVLLYQRKRPQIIILDMSLEDHTSGDDLIYEMRRQEYPVKIMVLTGNEFAMSSNPREMGADRCLLKKVNAKILVQTLLEMAAEPLTLNYGIRSAASDKLYPQYLTPEEVEILQMTVDGITSPRIAEKMVMSLASLDVKKSRMFAKLGVPNITSAVAYAVHYRLIEYSDNQPEKASKTRKIGKT